MGKLYVGILKSANTAALRSKATFLNEMDYMEVSAINRGAVELLLGAIDEDKWMSSEAVSGTPGEVDGIKLPPDVITS